MQLLNLGNVTKSNPVNFRPQIYSHLKKTIYALFIILFLNGCASRNHISQDYQPSTNFTTLKTFAFKNVSSDIPNTNNSAIQNVIEKSLTNQGFQLTNNHPDFVINVNIISQKSSGPTTGLGFSIGLPVGNHGSIGLGTSKLLAHDNQKEGLIIIDLTAQPSNQVIWRGTADAIPMSYFLIRNEALLNGVMEQLVTQFPPK